MTRRRIAATTASLLLVTLLIAAVVGLRGVYGADAGDRGIDRPLEKEGLHIAALGTSLTYASTWPNELESSLRACGLADAAVLTFARNSATSRDASAQAEDALEAAADVVLLEFAINDADLKIGTGLAESWRNHLAVIERLESAAAPPAIVLMTTNPAYGRNGRRRPLLGLYYAQLRRIADERQVALADVRPRWDDLDVPRRSAIPDGLHPTDAFARDLIVPVLAWLIADAAGETCREG